VPAGVVEKRPEVIQAPDHHRNGLSFLDRQTRNARVHSAVHTSGLRESDGSIGTCSAALKMTRRLRTASRSAAFRTSRIRCCAARPTLGLPHRPAGGQLLVPLPDGGERARDIGCLEVPQFDVPEQRDQVGIDAAPTRSPRPWPPAPRPSSRRPHHLCDSCGENLSDDPRSGGFLFGRGARPSGGKPFCPWTCLFGITFGMPRADRITLTAKGLAIPSVDHLSNKGVLNVLLDRSFSSLPAGLPPDRTMFGLFMNFSRLTDKALREYDAARAELLDYVSRRSQRQAADRPGNPSAQARGDDAVADQQPPRADPADNHPLLTARPSGAPCRAATTPGGAAPRDGLGSGHGQGHDQRGEGQRPDDA